MAKTSRRKTEKKELPGVPLEWFEAGVRALVDLRDRGKFLVFLSSRRSAQLVGPRTEFFEEFSRQLDGAKRERQESEQVLNEIGRYLSLRFALGDCDRVVHFHVHSLYDDEFKELEESGKKRFQEQLEKKASLVEERLQTLALELRGKRLETTTIACLEDMEFELVEGRATSTQEEMFDDPFLRLRLRYSKGTDQVPRQFGMFAGMFAGFRLSGAEHSFEIECDESDIDLLMLRLAEAKRRLLAARESDANG